MSRELSKRARVPLPRPFDGSMVTFTASIRQPDAAASRGSAMHLRGVADAHVVQPGAKSVCADVGREPSVPRAGASGAIRVVMKRGLPGENVGSRRNQLDQGGP
jgi:hypothetical protein